MPGEFLSTQGNRIITASGSGFRICGVNWFGMETFERTPLGLTKRSYKSILDQVRAMGFNTVRLPFSTESMHTAEFPLSIDPGHNPELVNKSALDIMDAIIEYAGSIDLRILLDRHRVTSGAGPQEAGRWYIAGANASAPWKSYDQWIADWAALAARYANNPTVIGADLHNEPQYSKDFGLAKNIEWGGNDKLFSWRTAAQECGNAILAQNPQWLIFVQGMARTGAGESPSDFYWLGGNFKGLHDSPPITLNVPNRLVYSPHDYPPFVFSEQYWFADPAYPANLPATYDEFWGFVSKNAIAPIVIGEMGSWLSKLQPSTQPNHVSTPEKELAWAQTLVQYLEVNSTMGWIWWSLNPESGDTGGVFEDDWHTVRQEVLDVTAPIRG